MRQYVCDHCKAPIKEIGVKSGTCTITMSDPEEYGFDQLDIRTKYEPKKGGRSTNWEIDLCKECLIMIIECAKDQVRGWRD